MAVSDTDRDATLATVRSVMSRVFGVRESAIVEATKPGDIARWDSLNMVVVAIGLERRLGHPVDVTTCLGATSVGSLVDALCQRRE